MKKFVAAAPFSPSKVVLCVFFWLMLFACGVQAQDLRAEAPFEKALLPAPLLLRCVKTVDEICGGTRLLGKRLLSPTPPPAKTFIGGIGDVTGHLVAVNKYFR